MNMDTPPTRSTATDVEDAYLENKSVEAFEQTKDERFADSISSRDPSPVHRNPDFPKSASYTYLPHAKDSAYNSAISLPITIKGSFSEDDLIAPPDSTDISPPESSGWTTPNDEPKVPADIARDLIAELQKNPKISISRPAQDTLYVERRGSQVKDEAQGLLIRGVSASESRPTSRRTASSASRSTLSISRKSSRSPSPKDSLNMTTLRGGADGGPAPFQNRMRLSLKKSRSVKEKSDNGAPSRSRSILRRKSTKHVEPPQSQPLAPAGSRPSTAVPLLPKSFSTDKLPVVHETYRSDQTSVPVPRIPSGERIAPLSALSPLRKRDELWTIFRALETDYAKFSSKSTSLKANVVRSTLIPFLRNYADHPSNRQLRSEDLDRRVHTLNKWWTGLLEMLHGKNNQSLSGTDRPAILDALSGLMDRPEWRPSPSPFCPIRHRGTRMPMSRNVSTTSVLSASGEFLTESIHHNVRTLFVHNLNSQMSFVVDKMSLRSASASLVTFCGKATAYAFFYCPGIADVLVRLWSVPTDTMKRVLHENGVGKFDNLRETSANIVSAFPPPIQQLGFSALSKMTRELRNAPPLPPGTANIQWYGFWLERWLGRESDLFYAFVKQFHILVIDYLPAKASHKERICVPAMLLVQAQILTNLDAIIHRNGESSQNELSTGPSSQDGFFGDEDAVASPMPVLPPNAVRIMAENRIIMLIRDFLSERSADHPVARQVFAESFNHLLQACARGTSRYDHGACYTLCDFLEEGFLIFARYEQLHPHEGPLLQSSFWLDVWKKMISSHNTMTEIRLYAFLYTVWTPMISNSARKADICLGLLLDEDIFERTFNHWCPMVRAYYMRLLCWRVARFDGEAAEGDRKILETLYERLQSVWSHYLCLKNEAEQSQTLLPPTAPCNPAPGRRLLIVRTDTQVAPGGSFLAFNGVLPPTPTAPLPIAVPESKLRTTHSHMPELERRHTSVPSSPDLDSDADLEGGLRGFLRSIMGGSSKPKSKSRTPSRNASQTASATNSPPPEMVSITRAASDDPRILRARPVGSRASSTPPLLTHRNFCFKFSLEFLNKMASKAPGNMRLIPPRLPTPAQILVQTMSPRQGSKLHLQVRLKAPTGEAKLSSRYAGRALAEWTIVVGECSSFFERRKGEGVPGDRYVETPTLGVEVLRKSS